MRLNTRQVLALQLIVWMMLLIAAPIDTFAQTRQPALSAALADLHLPTYVWAARSKPKAILVGVHGGCLHGKAYDGLAKELKNRNYTFVSMDLRGYGKWYRDDFGTKRDTTFHYGDSLKDIRLVLQKIHSTYPNVPVFILGESLGANLGVIAAVNNPELIDGIVAVSFTCSRVFVSPRMLANTAQVLTMPTSKLNLKPYLRTRLGSNPQQVQAHLTDPEARDEQSISELMKSMYMNLKGQRWTKRLPTYMPVLVINGETDKLSNSASTAKLFKKSPVQDLTVVTLPKTGHLLAETAPIDPRVMASMHQWLESQTQTFVAARANKRKIMAATTAVSTQRL